MKILYSMLFLAAGLVALEAAPKERRAPMVPVLEWTDRDGNAIDTAPPPRRVKTLKGEIEMPELSYEVEIEDGVATSSLDEATGLPLPALPSFNGATGTYRVRHLLPGDSESSCEVFGRSLEGQPNIFIEFRLAVKAGESSDSVDLSVCGARFSLSVVQTEGSFEMLELRWEGKDRSSAKCIYLGARDGRPVATPPMVIEVDRVERVWRLWMGSKTIVEGQPLPIVEDRSLRVIPGGDFEAIYLQDLFIYRERPDGLFRERRMEIAEERMARRLSGEPPSESSFNERLKLQRKNAVSKSVGKGGRE